MINVLKSYFCIIFALGTIAYLCAFILIRKFIKYNFDNYFNNKYGYNKFFIRELIATGAISIITFLWLQICILPILI